MFVVAVVASAALLQGAAAFKAEPKANLTSGDRMEKGDQVLVGSTYIDNPILVSPTLRTVNKLAFPCL